MLMIHLIYGQLKLNPFRDPLRNYVEYDTELPLQEQENQSMLFMFLIDWCYPCECQIPTIFMQSYSQTEQSPRRKPSGREVEGLVQLK